MIKEAIIPPIDLNSEDFDEPEIQPAPTSVVPGAIERFIRLQDFRFNSGKPIKKPQAVISIDGHILATRGNIVTFAGQPKAGKSGIVSAIVAGTMVMNGDIIDLLGLTIEPNRNGKAVIHIDNEQSPYDHYKSMLQVLKRASRSTEPDWFHSYNLMLRTEQERCQDLKDICEILASQYNGIHLIVLDGGADFCKDTNEQKESNEVVHLFSELAVKFDCSIVTVLHFNPGSEKGRGHFGSQLERKSESVISVSKDPDSEVSTIQGKLLRNSGNIPNLQFIYDQEKGYHVYHGVRSKVDRKEGKLTKLQEIVDGIFCTPETAFTYTELCAQIQDFSMVKERSAKNYIRDLSKGKFILRNEAQKFIKASV